jgi:hypothetical protein
MATVSSRIIVDQIIEADGQYCGDPQVVLIVEYNNMFNGDPAWGLVYEDEDLERYHKSPACHNARTIWQHGISAVNHG